MSADPNTDAEQARLLRLCGETVEVDRHYRAVFSDIVSGVVTTLSTVANDPGQPGFSRIYGPIDPSLDDDDPLARLERQYEFESVLDVARTVKPDAPLSIVQCETLLCLFTVYCSVLAETWGLYQDSDLDELSLDRYTTLGLAQMMQYELLTVLDDE